MRASKEICRKWGTQFYGYLLQKHPFAAEGGILCIGDYVEGPDSVGVVSGIHNAAPSRAQQIINSLHDRAS